MSDPEKEVNETLMAINARLEHALSLRGMGDFDEAAWKIITDLSKRLPPPKARHRLSAMGLNSKSSTNGG